MFDWYNLDAYLEFSSCHSRWCSSDCSHYDKRLLGEKI